MRLYKVVRRHKGALVSANRAVPDEWTVTYIPGVRVVPKWGGIFCFTTVESARMFSVVVEESAVAPQCEVWEVLGEDPQPVSSILLASSLTLYGRIFWTRGCHNKPWSSDVNDTYRPHLVSPIYNTRVCSAVTLLNKI